MVLGNRLFRRRIGRFRPSSSLFSRIAGLFRSCLPKTNIVVPVKEHDSEMVHGSSQSAAKEINNNIIDAFTVACASGKSYEEFEEEREVRSQTNLIRVRSNETTDEFDDDEEFFADAELSLDSENSDISDSFSSVSLPILSSEHIDNDSASNDDHAEIDAESTIQRSSSKNLEQDVKEDNAACSEQEVNANSVLEDLGEEYLKQDILSTPKEEEIVVSDGDLSIDDLINDLLQSPLSKSDIVASNSGSSLEHDLPGLESESSSGISCTLNSTATIENADDACVPDIDVASHLPADQQDTEVDTAEIEAAETDASVADATITDTERDHAATADTDEDTAANSDIAFEPEATSEQEVCSSGKSPSPAFDAKDAIETFGGTSSDLCIDEEECGSLDSWSTDYLLNKANDDYADDSFESYVEEDQLSADEACSFDYSQKDRLKNRDDDNDILTPEEVREIIAAAKERLRQATDNVKSILKLRGNSSKFAKKNVKFAEYHEGPAYRQKASGNKSDTESCKNFSSKSETEQTDSRSVQEMIAAAKQRLNHAADKVKDYVTGEGPRFQFRSTGNDAETANDVETVANQDVAMNSLENFQEEYEEPESPVGVRKANSFTMFIPFGETSDLQRRNQHLFFQGKNREIEEYDPYTEIDDHANELYDQLNFDTYADSEAFAMQHGQESSILQIQAHE